MKYLITYDISDTRRWNKLFRYLKKQGLNVQLSCFEVEVDKINDIRDEILNIIDDDEDSVYIFPVGGIAASLTVKLGKRESINESKIL